LPDYSLSDFRYLIILIAFVEKSAIKRIIAPSKINPLIMHLYFNVAIKEKL